MHYPKYDFKFKKSAQNPKLSHADNMTLINCPIQNCMRKDCSVRRKVETCLKTTPIIGKGIQVREPVGYGNFGNMKSLVIMKFIFY